MAAISKREIDASSLKHFLADGQLLIHVVDAVSPSIKYLCVIVLALWMLLLWLMTIRKLFLL